MIELFYIFIKIFNSVKKKYLNFDKILIHIRYNYNKNFFDNIKF